MTKAANTHESQGSSNGRDSKAIMPKRLSLRRKSNPDTTTEVVAAATSSSGVKSSSGMFSKLRPAARGGTTKQQRARTTGTIGKELAEKQIGSIEFLQNKGLDSSDFKPRQEHPLMAAAASRAPDGMDVSGKTEASSETTST